MIPAGVPGRPCSEPPLDETAGRAATLGSELAAISPWLTVVEAARWAGYPCPNDRAPNGFYEIARLIGHRVNGRWLLHREELDAYLRSQ